MKVHQRGIPHIHYPFQVKNVTLSNVRCFEGTHQFKICPLTIIIGENSTGKSTTLECIQALGNLLNIGTGDLNFNRDPYCMDSFVNIARKQVDNLVGASHFDISLKIVVENIHVVNLLVKVAKSQNGPEPVIQQVSMKIQEGGVEVILQWSVEEINNIIAVYNTDTEFSVERSENCFILNMNVQTNNSIDFMLGRIMRYNFRRVLEQLNDSDKREFDMYLKKIFASSGYSSHTTHQNDSHYSTVESFIPPYGNFGFTSISPIRSKPSRTYIPERQVEDPEGYEMATLLVNKFRLNTEKWETIKAQLEQFGQSSGLFEEIDVRPLGEFDNDPFQIMVKIRKCPKVNYNDVGYGVSQLLPILVRIFNSNNRRVTFLMQQPEVHLHPIIQAEFTSLLVTSLKKLPHSYIVETHSEYIVDRMRIEIMNGGIKPSDVSLIFVEQNGDKVETHNISFDEQSNFIDAPVGFQDFFLKEVHALHGLME